MDFDVGGEKLCRYLPQDMNEMEREREKRSQSGRPDDGAEG